MLIPEGEYGAGGHGTDRNMTEREGEELPVEDGAAGGGDPVKTQPASVLTGSHDRGACRRGFR